MSSEVRNLLSSLRREDIGSETYRVLEDLYPLCRSITGAGLRATLRSLQNEVPLRVMEIPSGTQVFDWSIPREWNITDAYVKDERGNRVIDFQKSNLHVVNYSVPVDAKMRLSDLAPHLHTLPEHPEWIPYRTSYYADTWGFCLSERARLGLREDEEYEVRIESTLADGHLSYGELLVRGETDDEVLLSTHVCHPSLCNDNLSGVAVASRVAKYLRSLSLHYSYRFLFVPGTIGAITWLAMNAGAAKRVKHGLVLTCLGDAGSPTYKRSRRGDAEIDRVLSAVLQQREGGGTIVDFSPDGYDERQYCSPAFDLPVGCLMRTPWGQFPEYHTSADDLGLVRPDALADSFFTILEALAVLEENRTYVSLNPACEPQLGKRGLLRTMGGAADQSVAVLALRWVLNLSDGHHSLLDISIRAGVRFADVSRAADDLLACELLAEATSESPPALPDLLGSS